MEIIYFMYITLAIAAVLLMWVLYDICKHSCEHLTTERDFVKTHKPKKKWNNKKLTNT